MRSIRRACRWSCAAWLAAAVCLQAATASAQAVGKAEPLTFEKDVRPILKTHCFHCHGDEDVHQAALDMRLVRLMLAGGESGPAIVPSKPDESLVVERIKANEMPPGNKKLSERERGTIVEWIRQGARTVRPEPQSLARDSHWTDEERGFWSLQPVKRPQPPSVRDAQLVRTPIDAFLLAELERRGASFSPVADRRTLIRRLSFDLTGLPPSAERVTKFVTDDSPDAYSRLVDELLASPAYGERWARHWLDPAGYADSDGYTENDPVRPWAYRYRDYVIRALNADKPWDQFVTEQLAGDELIDHKYENLSGEDVDKLTATGFLRMAPDGTDDGSVDQNLARNEVMAETLKIVSTSLLGMTVGCAQCHNHRYDPISQEDYYRFRAIFEPALDWKNWRGPGDRLLNQWSGMEHWRARQVEDEVKQIETRRLAELGKVVLEILEKELAKLDEALRVPARTARDTPPDQRTPEQRQLLKDHPSLNVDGGSAYLYDPTRIKELNDRYAKLTRETQAKRPAESYIACLTEVPGRFPATYLFNRGDVNQPRQQLFPGELSVLSACTSSIPVCDSTRITTGRRLVLARSLTSGRHPLTSRVLVNRVWMHHFGRGLVATPADFGVLGERPSHPELLDWLADEFVRSGWRLKTLHRLLVTSTAYQQSSRRTDALQRLDPDNRLLGRMSVRRLEAEAIRDAILEVSGKRSATMFGPAVPVAPDEVGQIVLGSGTVGGNSINVTDTSLGAQLFRRSIYVQVRRSMPLGSLEPFDMATTAPNCERRSYSTAAPQALFMMNNAFLLQHAQFFAQRVAATAGDDPAAQVRLAWQIAFAREATPIDVADAVRLLEAQRQYYQAQPVGKDAPAPEPAGVRALASFCQALLCSNQFLYVE